ncbi:MAG: single-stranded-DNA-specific exonuclease RecJ [Planctomycetes bacterium]|nr:single-stranded-DNA-specific exonuclease RecJ [Planctomycetota bacterium]
MLTPVRPWAGKEPPSDVVAELEHELRVGRITARLLALRGVQGPDQANSYFAKRLQDLHRPELMLGIDVAAQRFAKAINERERILVHGDYDVDGSTAASLLALFARACGHEATAWIPHRRIDGYGLGEASLLAVTEHRAQLMITVDCGIADHGFAARIESETGCTVVITDHHLPQSSLPACTAVCNPNQPGCTYPDKGLAGVGVAWKLAWATAKVLCGSDKITPQLREFLLGSLALVAVGTVADCAVLTGENRILVHHGLLALARTQNPGLRSLLEHTRLAEAVTAGDVGWKLGPLLNAAGRVGSAMANIRLLTARSQIEAIESLNQIVVENEERKRLTQILTDDLIARMESDPLAQMRASVVFAGEGWHQGVVGIVASRLVDRFGKPAAVIAIADGIGKGSLRSIPRVHLGEAIEACRAHLLKGGGHAMAAGLSIDAGSIAAFTEAFERHVGARVPAGHGAPRTDYDGEALIGELDQEFFQSLERMAPFGIANPEPVIRLKQVSFVSRPRLFGKDGGHLKGALTDAGGGMREFLAWRVKKQFMDFSTTGSRFDVLVRPEAGRWRGELTPRLVFVDGQSG